MVTAFAIIMDMRVFRILEGNRVGNFIDRGHDCIVDIDIASLGGNT